MSSTYSFESDLTFDDAAKMFGAIEHWVRKPDLDGKWLIRDNDRWGDYLSWYGHDETDPRILKKISIFFDINPKQVTLSVSTPDQPGSRTEHIQKIWKDHESYVLRVLLPRLGARSIQPSDFER